jgi:hypothetical protein
MNFADMLSYADIQDLSRIAAKYECECNSHSKNELIQSILMKVSRKEEFEHQVSRLSMEEIRFLNTLMFDARSLFSIEELLARVNLTRFKQEDDNWNPRETISRFKALGWIFHGFSLQTKYLYQVPQDFKNRFNEVLSRKFQASLDYTEEPDVYRDEQTLLVDDIERFLRFVDQQNVLMTIDQFIYKKILGQVLDTLSVQEEPITKGGWRFGYGRKFKEYPSRFSLIYDYCFFNKLIAEGEGAVLLTPEGKLRVDKGIKESASDLYRFWLRLYKGPIPNLQSIVHWINQLGREWVSVISLGDVLCQFIRPYYYDSPESIFEQRIVQMLMHLGLVAIGETKGTAGQTLRVTKLGVAILTSNLEREESAIKLQHD